MHAVRTIAPVLSEPAWANRLTDADRRALTPLFWTHVNPYGTFTLDMDSQLDLDAPAAAATTAEFGLPVTPTRAPAI